MNGSSGPNSDFFVIPDGVTFVTIVAAGSGGGGGGGGPQLPGGSGGSGAYGTLGVSVSPGDRFTWSFGGGGTGGLPCGNGNTPNNGGGGCFAGPGWPTRVYNKDGRQIMAAGGGGGGGRNISGQNGSGSVDAGGSMSTGGAGNGGGGGGVTGIPCVGYDFAYGQAGGPGYVQMFYTVNIEGASWSTLINGINDQYKASFNRPPNVDEMDYWIGEYLNYNADSVSQLKGWIASGSAFRSSTGAISYCGSRI